MFGVDHNLNTTEPLVKIPADNESIVHHDHCKFQNTQARKLHLEYQQVMRKMALQKKMEEKEERARRRVEEMRREKGEKGKKKGLRNITVDRFGSFQGKGGEAAKKKEDEGTGEFTFGGSFYKKAKVKRKESAKNSLHIPLNRSTNLKENLFKIYHNPKSSSNLPLLTKAGFINRTFHRQKSRSPSPTGNATQGIHQKRESKNMELIDFGIFSQHRTCETFLKKLKQATEKEFIFPVDPTSEEDMNKFQLILLRELKNQGQNFGEF